MKRTLLVLLLSPVAVALAAEGAAHAQFGPAGGGMGPGGGGMGPQPKAEESRETGPAEEAPDEEKAQPSDLKPVGQYQSQARRTTQVIELDGYMRLRSELFHKFDLGTGYASNTPGQTPYYPLPLECGTADRCGAHDLAGANIRLRLEPTINVTDQIRVHTQVDVLDNLFLGSTPDSLLNYQRPGDRTNKAPVSALYTTQNAPEAGVNSLNGSVRAKRAWGEIDSEFGSIMFGRMPWHFGRGLMFNSGACQDCDGGTTVDRILGTTSLYGHQFSLSWDFGPQGYNSSIADLSGNNQQGARPRDPELSPIDLSQKDDVFQLMASVTRIDDDRKFFEKVNQGDLAVNYGLQLVYRKLGNEVIGAQVGANGTPLDTSMTGVTTGAPTLGTLTDPVNYKKNVGALLFLPSLWFKLGWKALTIEAEASGIVGRIDRPYLLTTDGNQRLSVRQLGWSIASELRLFQDTFFIGFETGGATGDQAEDETRGFLNYQLRGPTRQPPGDRSLNDFKFSPEYHVDQILFRRILGTVSNAVYLKPSLTYWLDLGDTRQVGLTGAAIYSLAAVPVSTPGNALTYGLEMDLGLTYRNLGAGLYGGLTWAVLWPLSALDRLDSVNGGNGVKMDASAAQALRLFMGIRF